jgi:hypothetical protein
VIAQEGIWLFRTAEVDTISLYPIEPGGVTGSD